MNVNKKLDRLKQWAGERMGGEVKTNVSDDFKALEIEMALRHEGKLHSCNKIHIMVVISDLDSRRHGTSTKIHDSICQNTFEAERRRR